MKFWGALSINCTNKYHLHKRPNHARKVLAVRTALSRTELPSPGDKQQDDRQSGLRALAEMIATAYRRRITGETDTALFSSKNGEKTSGVEVRTIHYAKPEDLRHEGEYTEIVKVGTFLRRKAPQVGKLRTHEVVEVGIRAVSRQSKPYLEDKDDDRV